MFFKIMTLALTPSMKFICNKIVVRISFFFNKLKKLVTQFQMNNKLPIQLSKLKQLLTVVKVLCQKKINTFLSQFRKK